DGDGEAAGGRVREESKHLGGVEIVRTGDGVEAAAEEVAGGERVAGVQREVAMQCGAGAGTLAEIGDGAEVADEDSVRFEAREAGVVALLARLLDPDGGDDDPEPCAAGS